MLRFQRNVIGLAVLMGGLLPSSQSQTFIRAVLPNPAHQPAVGYNFQILTPGVVHMAVLRDNVNDSSAVQTEPTKLTGVSFNSHVPYANDTSLLVGIHSKKDSVNFAFQNQLPADRKIDLRIAFSPKDYWRVYFKDTFQYADGHTVRSRIPYAAFFVNFTPTKDPSKVMASLTVINNIASTYGIPASIANDDNRPTINFRRAKVYVNNSMRTYTLASFDHPDGHLVDLPDSFSLKKGQEQVFDLGIVPRNSYVFTQSEVSYEGSHETFAIACAHSPDAAELKDDSSISPVVDGTRPAESSNSSDAGQNSYDQLSIGNPQNITKTDSSLNHVNSRGDQVPKAKNSDKGVPLQ